MPLMGKNFKKGFELAFKNSNLSNIDIQPVFVNQGSKQDVQKASEKLILYDDADFVCGIISTRVSTLLIDFFKDKDVPVLINNLGENIFVKEEIPDYYYLNSAHLWKSQWALGNWAQKEFGGDLSLCMTIYDAGYHMHEAFRLGSVAAGGETAHVNVLRIQPGIVNTNSLIEHISDQKPGHVHAVLCGKDAHDFWMRFKKAGFLGKIPLTVSPFFFETIEEDINNGVAAEVCTASGWANEEKIMESSFAKSFTEEYEINPCIFSIMGYESGLLLVQAIKNAKTKNELKSRLKESKIQGPRGTVSYNFVDTGNRHEVYLKKYKIGQNDNNEKKDVQPLTGPAFENKAVQNMAIKGVSGWQNPYLCI